MHDVNNDIKFEIYNTWSQLNEKCFKKKEQPQVFLQYWTYWTSQMNSAMAYAEWNLLKPQGRVHTGSLVAGDSCRWGSVHLTDQADSQVGY